MIFPPRSVCTTFPFDHQLNCKTYVNIISIFEMHNNNIIVLIYLSGSDRPLVTMNIISNNSYWNGSAEQSSIP